MPFRKDKPGTLVLADLTAFLPRGEPVGRIGPVRVILGPKYVSCASPERGDALVVTSIAIKADTVTLWTIFLL